MIGRLRGWRGRGRRVPWSRPWGALLALALGCATSRPLPDVLHDGPEDGAWPAPRAALPAVLDDTGTLSDERRRSLTAGYVRLGRISVKVELGRGRALREAANRGADAVLLSRGTVYAEDADWRVTSGHGWYGRRPWKTKTDTWDLELYRRRE